LGRRSSSTFQKRQRELAKADKRRDKIERRQQRSSESERDGSGPPIEAIDPADLGLPELADLGEDSDKEE
jgi:hypothetical protein